VKTSLPNSVVYQWLCRVVGGQDSAALGDCAAAGYLQPLYDMAYAHDVLPALAVRDQQRSEQAQLFDETTAQCLRDSLRDNTLRNMTICAQALKIARQLNLVGITPLFLKGTARLLAAQKENLGFRKQVDIDLLVDPSQLEAAGDVFLKQGYRYQLPGAASTSQQELMDTRDAVQRSAAHHHLPVLIKPGYGTSVELHRHYLPGRFQRNNRLAPLFASAQELQLQSARFMVPAPQHQMVHLVLGKLVNDGVLARRSFAIREACDFIELLDESAAAIDLAMVERHCGRQFALFHTLVVELMGYNSPLDIAPLSSARRYLSLLRQRLDRPLARSFLDGLARMDYLSHELAFSPAKLPGYLGRLISR
jgi:hypothetical protein